MLDVDGQFERFRFSWRDGETLYSEGSKLWSNHLLCHLQLHKTGNAEWGKRTFASPELRLFEFGADPI